MASREDQTGESGENATKPAIGGTSRRQILSTNKKARYLALVAGSVDEKRNYQTPVIDAAVAVAASQDLGAALARKGFRLAVSSADPAYIEGDVVRGFVQGLPREPKKDRTGRIEVRAPISADMDFPERKAHPDVFVTKTDPSRGWRRSFVMALAEADAVVLVGGERMTATIGHAAAAFRIPVVALAVFGGAAREVWEDLKSGIGNDLLREEHELMAAPRWSQAEADTCATQLVAQIERRRATDAASEKTVRRARWRLGTRAAVGAAVALVTIAAAAAAGRLDADSTYSAAALYLLGPVGGFGAALVASSLQPDPPRSILHEGALGLIAGLLASGVYLLAQLSSKTFKPEGFAFLFATLTGIVAGLTAERVVRGWMAGKNRLSTPGHH